MIIGIDHGFYAIKTSHCTFPAGVTPYSYAPYTLKNTIEYNGKFYVCGTGRQPLHRDKTDNENYFVLTLAAIAEELKWYGASPVSTVRIAAGLPLTNYGREREPFRKYLMGDTQPILFSYEGQPYEITIEQVLILPQGYSVLSVRRDVLDDEPSILLMDIGGWTVDLARIDGDNANAATCRSLELGMIRCVEETIELVRRDTGLSLTEAQIERVLNKQKCSVSDAASEIIQQHGRAYVERLIAASMEAGFDLKALPVVMMGGGSAIVEKYILPKDQLCKVTVLPDSRLNAQGYEQIAKAYPTTGGRK